MRLPEAPRGQQVRRSPLVVLAVVGFYFAVSRLIPHDDLQQLLEDISQALGDWTYLLVGALRLPGDRRLRRAGRARARR